MKALAWLFVLRAARCRSRSDAPQRGHRRKKGQPSSSPGQPSVGVCWTRNEIRPGADPLEPWRELRASATTFRHAHPDIATCLFTSAAKRDAEAGVAALDLKYGPLHGGEVKGKLFTHVVAQDDLSVLNTYAGFARVAKRQDDLRRSKAVRLDSLWTKFMSRLMRIHNLARSPFDLTLFADDDTVWCPSGDLAARLRALGDPAAGAPRGADSPRPDVRFVPQASAKGNVDDARLEAERLRETAACARALGDGAWVFCWDAGAAARQAIAENEPPPAARPRCPSLSADLATHSQRLQGGAIFARRSPRLDVFARDWIERFLRLYGDELEKTPDAYGEGLGSDQPPLRLLVKDRCGAEAVYNGSRWDVGALPAAYNGRFLVLSIRDGGFDVKTTASRAKLKAPSAWAGAVAGPLEMLHSHGHAKWQEHHPGLLLQTDAVCAALNADLGVRTLQDGATTGSVHGVYVGVGR